MERFNAPHRRYNPLTGEWVLCSPHRTQRPWLGHLEDENRVEPPGYDPRCYLCPGNKRANGEINPAYKATFVFDNDFPALLPNTDPWETNEGELLVAASEGGICRVVCFSPRHDLSLPQMDRAEIAAVIDTWARQFSELAERADVRYVQIFENKGEAMGCSNPHPHCQIWAQGHIPTIPRQKLRHQEEYFRAHGTDLLGDYLEMETRLGERIVCQNEHWTALVPFWAVWPYETMLVPAKRIADPAAMTGEEREALADIIKRLTTRYDNLFRTPFPYSMGWHARPADGGDYSCWRLHAVYYPPLLRSAQVRKFLVGYEMTAEPQRDITPEQAAATLREQSETHYLLGSQTL